MKILESINRFVWGIPALLLIICVGIYLSLCTGFAQFRLFPRAIKSFVSQFTGQKCGNNRISGYEALCTALAATVGTGNLAGVAGAITVGGPGAIFWMWICAIFGMVTKFAEASLAVRYRQMNNQDEWVGGPMYMIQNGLGKRWTWLGGIYCFFAVVAAFGVGNATQINAVVGGVNSVLLSAGIATSNIIDLFVGVALAVSIGVMLSGGAKRIGRVAQKLVPFASILYLLLGAGVLLTRISCIPSAFRMIFKGAFSPQAITGGIIGSLFQALRVGASRGVFTNEAGMGTASIAHASADVNHPVEQGLMGIVEVFLDTIVICTMTALVILCSGVEIPYGTDIGIALTTSAFSSVYGSWVNVLITLALCLFAIATIMGWGLYGARCAQYLFGETVWRPFVILQVITIILGAVLKTQTVWLISETVNGLMAIPNLIALAGLAPELRRLTKEYKKKQHKNAVGGTYENFNQCQSLRAVSYAEIPSLSSTGQKGWKKDLSSKYRPA